MRLKQTVFNHLKNIPGWSTKRKLIAIAVDDYGNVRLDSKKARENLDKACLKVHSRFDAYDTLETHQDLESLYEVLTSVKDKNGHPAVFTPYSLPCNINFEQMHEEDYQEYNYEHLPATFLKLSAQQPTAYEGTWKLWQEGVKKGFMRPEFHGREHLNLRVFAEKMQRRDHDFMINLQNRSYASINQKEFSNIKWTAAFSFEQTKEIQQFPKILETGIDAFESVFGYQPLAFTPPGRHFPPSLHPLLWDKGIQAIDRAILHKQHLGDGKYKRVLSRTHLNKDTGKVTLVRNVVFEPTDDRGIDWVAYALKQIKAALHWNKPAIISSHRVNFCGHIDPKNRERGLNSLRTLLRKVIELWPDVEFISVADLVKQIQRD